MNVKFNAPDAAHIELHPHIADVLNTSDVKPFNTILQTVKAAGLPRKDEVNFVLPCADQTKLTVFSNMVLNIKSSIRIKDATQIHMFRARVAPTLAIYKRDFKVPKIFDNKWRGKEGGTLRVKQDVSIPKYIRGILDCTITDHELRDIADKVEYALGNGGVNIVEAVTPEDFVELHKGAQSCMSTGSKHFGHGSVRNRIMDELGEWPSRFYAYCPQIEGLYVNSSGKPTARVFMWKEKGGRDVYGSLNSLTMASRDLLSAHLKGLGYNYYTNSLRITEFFDIPAITWNGHKLFPVPTCDVMYTDYGITYNEATDSFKCGPTGDIRVGNPYGCAGWISSTGLKAEELSKAP